MGMSYLAVNPYSPSYILWLSRTETPSITWAICHPIIYTKGPGEKPSHHMKAHYLPSCMQKFIRILAQGGCTCNASPARSTRTPRGRAGDGTMSSEHATSINTVNSGLTSTHNLLQQINTTPPPTYRQRRGAMGSNPSNLNTNPAAHLTSMIAN